MLAPRSCETWGMVDRHAQRCVSARAPVPRLRRASRRVPRGRSARRRRHRAAADEGRARRADPDGGAALRDGLRRARRAVHPQRPPRPRRCRRRRRRARGTGRHAGRRRLARSSAPTGSSASRRTRPRRSTRRQSSTLDYIGVGPVHETPTKPGRPAVGLELVRYAAASRARCRSSRSAGSTRRTLPRSPRRAPRGSRLCGH